jgi:hypothetical protein
MENEANKKALFSDPRWNDTSRPIVTGHREVTEEERQHAEAFHERVMKKMKKQTGAAIKETGDEKRG